MASSTNNGSAANVTRIQSFNPTARPACMARRIYTGRVLEETNIYIYITGYKRREEYIYEHAVFVFINLGSHVALCQILYMYTIYIYVHINYLEER